MADIEAACSEAAEGEECPGLGADGTTAPIHVRYKIFENKNAYMGPYTASQWDVSEYSGWTETKQFAHE